MRKTPEQMRDEAQTSILEAALHSRWSPEAKIKIINACAATIWSAGQIKGMQENQAAFERNFLP